MPQEIYNEGRVVGLSAWEIFKRQALNNGVPENEIPNEREWLASMIGSGASMVLRIKSGVTQGYNDFYLPYQSNLAAAGVIIATPFIGKCDWENSAKFAWAKKIISYGPTIQNDETRSPTSSEVPYESYENITVYQGCLTEYLKISDGIVYLNHANWLPRLEDRGTSFTGTGSQTTFELPTATSIPAVKSVTINSEDVDPSKYTYRVESHTLVFNTAPAENANISVYYSEVNNAPAKDVDPDFTRSSSVIRLMIEEDITQEVDILLTGFTDKHILQVLSGYAHDVDGYAVGGATDINTDPGTDFTYNDWKDGGLLGPELVPWASKIIFTIPNASRVLENRLNRTIPNNDSYYLPQVNFVYIDGIKVYGDASYANSPVQSGAIIDFNSIDLNDYYDVHPTGNVISEYVQYVSTGTNKNLNQIVAWYPGMTGNTLKAEIEAEEKSNAKFFPPALYAATLTNDSPQLQNKLVPLDTAAPGTVKGFKTIQEATDYKALLPDNYSIAYDSQRRSYLFALPGRPSTEWPATAYLQYDSTPPIANVTIGDKYVKLLHLNDPATGNLYSTNGTGGTLTVGPANNLTWHNILQALPNNYSIDVLGNALHVFGGELQADATIGHNGIIYDVKSNAITIAGDYPVGITTSQNSVDNTTNLATLGANQAYKSGTNFIEFGNGLRLYISDSAPDLTNVPEGSIGIGWAGSSNEEEIIATDPGELIDEHSTPALGGEG